MTRGSEVILLQRILDVYCGRFALVIKRKEILFEENFLICFLFYRKTEGIFYKLLNFIF